MNRRCDDWRREGLEPARRRLGATPRRTGVIALSVVTLSSLSSCLTAALWEGEARRTKNLDGEDAATIRFDEDTAEADWSFGAICVRILLTPLTALGDGLTLPVQLIFLEEDEQDADSSTYPR